MAGTTPAVAAETTTVDCDGQDDIADVQAAVDSAGNGDTIRLSGTCDFSPAPSHGGGVASIEAAAVVIRAGSPVTGLTIESSPGQTAGIAGSGTQTAFAVLPGNDDTTIRGLQFVNLGRPIVVLGATGVTVGQAGATVPAPGGNRMLGDGQTDTSVLAVASSQPMPIEFGASGPTMPSVSVTPSVLADLTVVGNQITYSPTGAADTSGARDVVAVDVRQVGTASVDNVTVSGNAIAMFGSELGSFRYNGVRVEGLTAVPHSNPPAMGDYRIQNVTVSDNNLGRFEELDPARLTGVNPDERHAAGRVGVLMIRVGGFSVTDNKVRSRLSGAGLGELGGGVVASDSSFGSISDNDIAVASDASASLEADLGGIGVVEGIPAVVGGGDPYSDQAATAVDVTGNIVGRAVTAPFVARRGIVVSGADKVTAWANTVVSQDRPSLLVGADIHEAEGPSLPERVARSVLCSNTLDGTVDASTEVAVSGSGHSGNAFPTGSGLIDNGECNPTAMASPASPAAVGPSESLTVSGRGWAARPFSVTVRDETGATAVKTGTALDGGTYSVVFTSSDLSPLQDGVLFVTTAVSHGALVRTSAQVYAHKNFVENPPPPGTVTISDGDGYTSALEVIGGITVHWASATTRPTVVTLWAVDVNGATPPACGPLLKDGSGGHVFPYDCTHRLADGPVEVRAKWHGSDTEVSTVVADTTVKDTSIPIVEIEAPEESAVVATGTVTVSGTASEAGTVTVRTVSWPYTVLGTAAVGTGGAWSTDIAFSNGDKSITAFATDVAGNEGPVAPTRRFVVNASTGGGGGGGGGGPVDTTPPAAPVITSPASGTLVAGTFAIFGTAEPFSTVFVFADGQFSRTTSVGSNGVWGVVLTLGNGSRPIETKAVDAANNVSPVSNTITVEVDTIAPTITISTPNDTIFGPLDPPLAIRGTATDAGDGHDVASILVEYRSVASQGGPVTTDIAQCPACPAPSVAWESSPDQPLPPGVYSARAVAVDRVGNASEQVVRYFKIP